MTLIPKRLELALDPEGRLLEVALEYLVTAGTAGRVLGGVQRATVTLTPATMALLEAQARSAADVVRAVEQLT